MKQVTFYLLHPLNNQQEQSLVFYPIGCHKPIQVRTLSYNKLIVEGQLMEIVNFTGWLGASGIPVICERVEDLSTTN